LKGELWEREMVEADEVYIGEDEKTMTPNHPEKY